MHRGHKLRRAAADVEAAEAAGNDANTVLLLHCDSDISNTGHTVTFNNTPVLKESGKWGGAIDFNGSNDYVSIPDHADFDIIATTSQDYTIDFWVKHTDHAGIEIYVVHLQAPSNRWRITHEDGVGLGFNYYNGATLINLSGGEITDTDWHHVALVKKGGASTAEYGLYLDGTQTAYSSDNSTGTITGSLTLAGTGGSNSYDGLMDELRIYKGNPFSANPNSTPDDTITVPTAAHTSDSNTVLLLQFNGNEAIGSGTTHDVTVANTGLVVAQEVNAAAFEQSYQYDGSSDYCTVPDHADWDVAGSTSQDYTLDMWVKHDDHAGTETYICQYEDSNNYWVLEHVHGTGLQFRVVSGGSTVVTLSGGEITDTNWTHIALCKVTSGGGSTVEYGLYKSGTQTAYVSDTSTDTFAGTLRLGALAPSNYFDGYLDEIRVQKSNWFNASPNATPDDTITVETTPYSA